MFVLSFQMGGIASKVKHSNGKVQLLLFQERQGREAACLFVVTVVLTAET